MIEEKDLAFNDSKTQRMAKRLWNFMFYKNIVKSYSWSAQCGGWVVMVNKK